jgi:DNA invertase Pin-like site-specific DNA recombinase
MKNTMNNTPRKVIAMVRVSSKKQAQEDATGLERQTEDVQAICEEQNLEVVPNGTFVLKGVTGSMVHASKEYRDMVRMLARTDIAGLVIPVFDRLSRTTGFSDMAELAKPFEEANLGKGGNKMLFAVVDKMPKNDGTVSDELDVMNPEHRTKIIAQWQFAEKERLAIRYRTLRGRNLKRKQVDAATDAYPAGVVFTRTDKTKNVGTWSYAPEARARMSRAFARILKGETLGAVMVEAGFNSKTALRDSLRNRWWNGFKTQTKTYASKVWSEEKGKFLMRQRVDLPTDKQFVQAVPELRANPVVSDEDFEAVQKILAKHVTEWSQKGTVSDNFLSHGVLRCSCGRKMYVKSRKNKLQIQNYYLCSWLAKTPAQREQAIAKGETACTSPMQRTEPLDARLIADVTTFFTDDDFIRSRVRETRNAEHIAEQQATVEAAKKTVASLETEKKSLARRLALVPEDMVAVVVNRMKELEQERIEAVGRLDVATAELDTTMSEADVETITGKLFTAFTNFPTMEPEQQKATLQRYLESVTVHVRTTGNSEMIHGSGSVGYVAGAHVNFGGGVNLKVKANSMIFFKDGKPVMVMNPPKDGIGLTFKLKPVALDSIDENEPTEPENGISENRSKSERRTSLSFSFGTAA